MGERNCPTCGKFMAKFGMYGMKYKCVDLWFNRSDMCWEHD